MMLKFFMVGFVERQEIIIPSKTCDSLGSLLMRAGCTGKCAFAYLVLLGNSGSMLDFLGG